MVSFGEYDAYVIVTLPDSVTAEALQIAGNAGGGFKVLRTTPLLSVAEAMTAMEKAGTIRPMPPAGRHMEPEEMNRTVERSPHLLRRDDISPFRGAIVVSCGGGKMPSSSV